MKSYFDEIVEACTDIDRKFWKNQKIIGLRGKRTQLFDGENLKEIWH
jgi:hypothetical protein